MHSLETYFTWYCYFVSFTGTHLACGSSLEQSCVPTTTFPPGLGSLLDQILFFFSLPYYISYCTWLKLWILAVSSQRSKIKIVVTTASCGALILVSLGALFLSRYKQHHKLRRPDVFVDVAGNYYYFSFIPFSSSTPKYYISATKLVLC